MSRPFCSHVAMLQDGASSGVLLVNKLVLSLVDFKMNIIKWILHFVSCNFGLKSNLWLQIALRFAVVRFCNHAFDFRPNCTPSGQSPLLMVSAKGWTIRYPGRGVEKCPLQEFFFLVGSFVRIFFS